MCPGPHHLGVYCGACHFVRAAMSRSLPLFSFLGINYTSCVPDLALVLHLVETWFRAWILVSIASFTTNGAPRMPPPAQTSPHALRNSHPNVGVDV